MEDDSQQGDSRVFSVRIVSIDYYMASPIPDLDISYSSFQGERVKEVPIIRVYGATPAGQKACVHIHKAFPYLYIPCSDIPVQSNVDGDATKNALLLALEKALKLKGNTGANRQHVHGCSIVRARKLYGCHSSEELFMKLYLYHPHDVARASSLLLGGAILEKSLQPHESHIPFLLQFLVDYNLGGMGLLHLIQMKFRQPVPDDLFHAKANYMNSIDMAESQAGTSAGYSVSRVWLKSTIPDGWIWHFSGEFTSSGDQNSRLVQRQSTCELEGDTTVDDILNQHFKMYTSFSQSSDVRMVQSLIPIWEEEYERSGMHVTGMLPDSSKPQPEVVLKTLSEGLKCKLNLAELCIKEKPSVDNHVVLRVRPLADEGRFNGSRNQGQDAGSLRCLKAIDAARLSPHNLVSPEVDVISASDGRTENSDLVDNTATAKVVEELDHKIADADAVSLLKWFASSQAAEDINSDDELLRDTIISPLLPASSIGKVIEKANVDYENESQQECRDILDSVEDASTEHLRKKASPISLCKMIPKMLVAGDAKLSDGAGNSSEEVDMNVSLTKVHCVTSEDPGSGFQSEVKTKQASWLPLSVSENVQSDIYFPQMDANDGSKNDFDLVSSLSAGHHGVNGSKSLSDTVDRDLGTLNDGKPLLGCSVRDLMRKKRCYKVEPLEQQHARVRGGYEEEWKGFHKKLEFQDEQLESHDLQPLNSMKCDNLQVHLMESCETTPNAATSSPHEASLDSPSLSTDPSPLPSTKNQEPDYATSFLSKNDAVRESDLHVSDVPTSHICINEPDQKFDHDDCSFVLKKLSEAQSSSGDENEYGQVNVNMIPYSCMLTPTCPPPSVDSVCQWLSLQDNGVLIEDVDAELNEPSYAEGSMESGAVSSNKLFSESTLVCSLTSILKSNDGFCRSPSSRKIDNLMAVEKQDEHGFLKLEERRLQSSQDNSQISGPSGRPTLTPLSQLGFRDPASVGGGQQLTLISIEVQAVCRGDLQPDPQIDAINIVTIAIQNDDANPEILVLLCGSTISCCRNIYGVPGWKVLGFPEERDMVDHLVKIIRSYDPDIIVGWDVQGCSLGFLAERSLTLGIHLLDKISRTPSALKVDEGHDKGDEDTVASQHLVANPTVHQESLIEDEWGRTHASGVYVGGRIVLNVWRLVRNEVRLNMYTVEAVVEVVLRRKFPSIPLTILNKWFLSDQGRARYKCIDYMVERAKLNLEILNALDMINRTSELARVFGIDFFSVLSRGSQYRVESMLIRLAHTQNYVAISPGYQQVACQPAMECLPLVMEPESGFYADPVIVLDFQSLYPSMIIAYNLCFCTCLGKIVPSKAEVLGVSTYSPDQHFLRELNQDILVSPNGVMYVPSKVRKGVLPCLLEEILSTRIMVKQAMKRLAPSQQILHRIFNARQLALKLIANVTYGYTAAGFSGRMPCAELADSIVQCGRRTLENAILVVNGHDRWRARVIYGDTDSMFVLVKGRNLSEAFQIGQEIASTITAMNPYPVTLKMEKVYQPCFLLTKKRYVGYSYESLEQLEPIFDAKGIETVRRDTCGAVAKILEKTLRIFFERQDILEVKAYLQCQWSRILSGRVSLQDFVFSKEVRLGTYSMRESSSLPPAAIVATKAMRIDPRAEPRYGERVPYVVVHGAPGARLVDMVVDPLELLDIDSPYRLNDLYYIKKQIIPALQRVFGLVGADLNQWFFEMPRIVRDAPSKHHFNPLNPQRTRIDYYYSSKHCVLCEELMQAGRHLCEQCSNQGAAAAAAVTGRTSKLERDIQHLAAICRHCGGGDWILESGVKCTSLACPVFYERRKVQKGLRALSTVANELGLYPKCKVEWF